MPEKYSDKEIIDAILKHEGFPSIMAIEKANGIDACTINYRARSSPDIASAIKAKWMEYVERITPREAVAKMPEKGWFTNIPEYAKGIVLGKLDGVLMEAVERCEGITTVSKMMEYSGLSNATVMRRIKENGALREAMDAKGEKCAEKAEWKELAGIISGRWLSGIHGRARAAVERRYDEAILDAIINCNCVPSCRVVAEIIGVNGSTISKRVQENPSLLEIMETRGREYLESLDDGGIIEEVKKTNEPGGMGQHDYARDIVARRFDEILMGKIREFDGFPTIPTVAEAAKVTAKPVRDRVEANPALAAEMEKRGMEYINGLSDEQLMAKRSEAGWMPNLPDRAKARVNERTDAVIMKRINGHDGVVFISDLSEGSSITTVEKRIGANQELWIAYYAKRGLTPDQAIELALERGDESEAAKDVLAKRLRHLYAFREMAGVIRCFGDLLKGKILGVSMYPNPLGEAAKELGVELNINHKAMRYVRKGQTLAFEKACMAVLQGLHRLSSEQITRLFRMVGDALEEGQEVIATHSTRHAQVEGFAEALQHNGFQLEEAGLMRIDAPGRDAILSHGAQMADVERIQRKMEGESRVLVFRRVEKAGDCPIPALQKLPNGEGEAKKDADAEEIDTPDGIVREISAKFLEDAVILPDGKYIVEVVDGEKPVALLSYDMHYAVRNKVEDEPLPGAPSLNYRAMARKMAHNIAERRRLGIRPNEITKVQLKQLK